MQSFVHMTPPNVLVAVSVLGFRACFLWWWCFRMSRFFVPGRCPDDLVSDFNRGYTLDTGMTHAGIFFTVNLYHAIIQIVGYNVFIFHFDVDQDGHSRHGSNFILSLSIWHWGKWWHKRVLYQRLWVTVLGVCWCSRWHWSVVLPLLILLHKWLLIQRVGIQLCPWYSLFSELFSNLCWYVCNHLLCNHLFSRSCSLLPMVMPIPVILNLMQLSVHRKTNWSNWCHLTLYLITETEWPLKLVCSLLEKEGRHSQDPRFCIVLDVAHG